MAFAILAVFVVGFLIWTWHANELFCVSVRDGRVLVVRGRIPAGLLSDIRDVVSRPAISRATIRAMKDAGGARLSVSGDVDAGRTQRLRNVFGLYPMSKLRSAPPVAKPTFGQMLGIAWIAWLLDRR
ncbi:Hypothetical protein A7982_11035 [Minicystis rosea]|nr:Hypothetical protein A7982_11035 [Minicystis rosea]